MKEILEINAGGVPEHFNMPWYIAQQQNRLEHSKIKLNWHDCPGGTGQMTQALRDGSLDIAVLLTEGIVADIFHGNPSKIVQFYVNSPLRWGIHVARNSEIKTLEDLKSKKYAISRLKSGSHLMAYVNADQNKLSITEDDFVIVNNLEGGRKALKEGTADVFLWEKFTTQPYVDNGEFRCIGECPTPWPCFVIAVNDSFLKQHKDAVKMTIHMINNIAHELTRSSNTVELIAQRFGLKMTDVQEWYQQLEWNYHQHQHDKALLEVIKKLNKLGIIEEGESVDLGRIRMNVMEKEEV